MSVFINNGLSGLLAAQRALQTTSNNVANANTEGYVRQRVEFAERPGQVIGGGFQVGTGVSVSGINRVYDQFVAEELKLATMSEQRAEATNALATRLDKLLGNPDQGIGKDLQSFFAQVDALNRDPSSTVNRQQLLAQGKALGERFGQLDRQVEQLGNEVDIRLSESVKQINNIADSLAVVNDRIAASGGTVSNDLLDEQDRLLGRLAEQIDFTTVRQGNGTINVLVGNGQPLVLDVRAFDLSLLQNEFDGSRVELAYRGQPISGLVSGGQVAGLLAFRNEGLDPARRELGQVALGLTEVFNDQHQRGVDFNGELGGDFFTRLTPTVASSSQNSGSGSVTVSIADPSAVQARDYVLRYTGSNWELLDAATGGPVSLSGSGTAGDPFQAQGLSIVTGAGAASGDRFLLSAVNGAAARVGLAISDAAQIAAAGPVTTSASLNNLSSAGISGAQVTDTTAPNLLQDVSIVFDDPSTYRIVDGGGADLTGPQPYTSGDDISFNGWTVQVSGATLPGDRFSISPTGPASGDNSNGLVLSDIAAKGFFANGTLSLSNLSANLIANVGSVAARSSESLNVQSALREQAELDMESVSGVNLEEEAVNMLRYQEAYMAASKIIGVANDLFRDLLAVVNR